MHVLHVLAMWKGSRSICRRLFSRFSSAGEGTGEAPMRSSYAVISYEHCRCLAFSQQCFDVEL
jgi:hypothetical protein